MGVKVARDDDVRVDGRSVTPEARLRYLALHKPIHVISSAADERGRPMVTDYVPEEFEERLFPVGRLDFETSGLILLTNDGRFARVVLHPSFEIEKEYQVQCRTDIPANLAERFEAGIRDDEGVRYKARSVHCLDRRHARVVLTEGKNREIRRVFSILGADIEELVRVRIGPIRLGGLRPGGTRSLRDREIQWFFRQEKLLQREGVREGGSRH
jgi:23S rRNA pseudouridine2605 synthase